MFQENIKEIFETLKNLQENFEEHSRKILRIFSENFMDI